MNASVAYCGKVTTCHVTFAPMTHFEPQQQRRLGTISAEIVDIHFLLTVIKKVSKAKVIILQSWDFLPASTEQTINEGAVNVFTFSPRNAN